MSHSLILGQTESGKTALAKQLAAQYSRAGINVIVLDPINDPSWNADFQTTDPEQFFEVYWKNQQCAAFFDESGELCKEYPAEMKKTATRGRHWGHSNLYIAQRAVLIPPTIRDQCNRMFLFASSLEDCKIHSAEWNQPALKEEGPKLAQLEYFSVQRMKPLKRGKVTF